MNAEINSVILLKKSLFLVITLAVLGTGVIQAATVTRVVPSIVQINSFSDFKHFDISGAIDFKVASIDDSGQVAGQYTDPSGSPHFFLYHSNDDKFTIKDFTVEVPSIIESNNLGQILGSAYNLPFTRLPKIYTFVYSDDSIIPLNGPEDSTGLTAYAGGLNNLGQGAGLYYSSSQARGYIYDINDKKYTAFDPPPLSESSNPYTLARVTGINDREQIIGALKNGSDRSKHLDRLSGFVYDKTNYTIFKVAKQSTLPIDINNNGQVVGVYGLLAETDLSPGGLFIYEDEKLAVIKPKTTLAGSFNSTHHRINDSGQIVGHTTNHTTGALQSYLYSNGIFAILSVPDALSTNVSDINNSGQIAGTYTDASGTHGFIATPVIPPAPVRNNLGGAESPPDR